MKFCGIVEHNTRTVRLDFRGNPDPDPDPGIFEGIFPLRYQQR